VATFFSPGRAQTSLFPISPPPEKRSFRSSPPGRPFFFPGAAGRQIALKPKHPLYRVRVLFNMFTTSFGRFPSCAFSLASSSAQPKISPFFATLGNKKRFFPIQHPTCQHFSSFLRFFFLSIFAANVVLFCRVTPLSPPPGAIWRFIEPSTALLSL